MKSAGGCGFVGDEKMKKYVYFLILNLGLLISVYMGVVLGNKNAQNIVHFAIPLLFIISGISLNDYSVQYLKKQNHKPVSSMVSNVFDTLILFMLVWHGWFLMSVLFLISVIFNKVLVFKTSGEGEN